MVALRAEMDALPVTEMVDVPFKSTVRTTYTGQETGVMLACGHDMHVAILMGTAEVLASLRDRIPGTVKFLFQPAEEVPPRGGAGPMIDAGAMKGVDGVFGLHVGPGPLGAIGYHAGAMSASADGWKIIVHGDQPDVVRREDEVLDVDRMLGGLGEPGARDHRYISLFERVDAGARAHSRRQWSELAGEFCIMRLYLRAERSVRRDSADGCWRSFARHDQQ